MPVALSIQARLRGSGFLEVSGAKAAIKQKCLQNGKQWRTPAGG